jgi:Ca-activated chloride channel family protein
MSFATPSWLLVGAIVLVLGVLGLRRADRRRRRDLAQFASPEILADLTATLSPRRRRAKRALWLAAAALCFVALAGPERGFDWEETQRRGVDVSRSMLARDVQPDRLRRAKLAVEDLVARLGGDRVGLIAFAGTAFLQCPLTLDHAAFERSLDALEPGIISAPGSDLASALDVARKALETEGKNVKLLVLFSDGEDLRGGAVAAAERAAEAGIRVFTVGVGTPAGELIPLHEDDAEGSFVKDAEGRIVKSRLDEATLRRVAEITGGFYVPLGPRAEGIEEIVERALAPIPREELASRLRRVPRNQFAWPLAFALLLLLVEPFLGERRRDGESAAVGRTAAVLVAVLAAGAPVAFAASVESAAELYATKEYERAAEEYGALAEESDDPRLDVNLGAASYRAGRFDDAASAFARALRSDDDSLKEQAFYDLGNAQYRIGEATVEADPSATIAAWEQAIGAYDEALTLDEVDADAKFNRDFVQRKLDELKQQMEQPEDEPNDEPQDQPPEPEDDPSKPDEPPPDGDPDGGDSGSSPAPSPTPRPEPSAGEDGSPPEEPQPTPGPEGAASPQSTSNAGEASTPRPSGDGSGDGDPGEADEAPADPGPPGGLTLEEARDLLDSVRGDEAFMPMVPAAPPPAEGEDPRDW